MNSKRKTAAFTLIAFGAASPALAHTGSHTTSESGLLPALAHFLASPDHVLPFLAAAAICSVIAIRLLQRRR